MHKDTNFAVCFWFAPQPPLHAQDQGCLGRQIRIDTDTYTDTYTDTDTDTQTNTHAHANMRSQHSPAGIDRLAQT